MSRQVDFFARRAEIAQIKTQLVSCLFLTISLTAQPAAEDSRTALNRGVAEFKSARYADAVAAFELAAKLEPGNVTARLYLGTAYMVQWIPGANSPENSDFAARAEAAFRAALLIDPREKTAIASLASLEFNQGKAIQAFPENLERGRHFDESEAWYRKLTEVDSADKTAFYSLGVIAWERFYPEWVMARGRLNMKQEDPGPLRDFNARADLKNRFSRTVEDGLAYLNRAIAIDPLYDHAMAYLNLLHRERADLSETAEEYKREVAIADEWVAKALDARKRKNGESGLGVAAATPPPPPADGTSRIRVGGNVQAANLIQKPVAVYPPLARQARVQGTVRFSIIIGRDGSVQNVQLVSGHPLLVPTAVDAVKQYVYKPTLLNGQPVEVVTVADVNFTLSN